MVVLKVSWCGIMTWDASRNASAYRNSTLGLYGSDAGWARSTAGRLEQWGFNTAGAWSSTEFEDGAGTTSRIISDCHPSEEASDNRT